MRSGLDNVRGAPGSLGGLSTSGVWLARAATEPPAGGITAQKSGNRRILLMSDDPDLAEWLLGSLRLAGASVAWREKAREGLMFMRSGLVDVVISEMGLADLPGLDLLRELRTMAKIPKIILTTSRHCDFLARYAIEAGATAVLGKPVQMEQLEALLIQLLGN